MMPESSRVLSPALRSRIMSAEDAAALSPSGVNVGMSGFTEAGCPRLVPHALAMVDGVELRLPDQSDPTSRKRINAGDLEYLDIHLSHLRTGRMLPA